jgi:hypothetical protein
MYAYSWWWYPMWIVIHGGLGFALSTFMLRKEPWAYKRIPVLLSTVTMMLLWAIVGIAYGQVPW